MIKLPLTSAAYRTFTCDLGDTTYRITTMWNDRAQVWTMDWELAADGTPPVSAMPIVLGADILKGFNPDLGTLLVIDMAAAAGFGTDAGPPESGDLGTRIVAIWAAPGELTSA
jgi:hypothetical protein